MSREAHVRFCEGVGVRLPRATRHVSSRSHRDCTIYSVTRGVQLDSLLLSVILQESNGDLAPLPFTLYNLVLHETAAA